MAPKRPGATATAGTKSNGTGNVKAAGAAAKAGKLPTKGPAKAPASKGPKNPDKAAGNKGASKPAKAQDPAQVKAATRIQAQARGFLTRKHLKQDAERKATMEAEMERLRQQAYVAQIAYERRQEAQRKARAEEQAKRKRVEAKLRKELLEAAFDDEFDALKSLLAQGKDLIDDIIDAADGHGHTLLSEAAAGGALQSCKYLLAQGANPNSQGEFQRTPLWRAAFLGKSDLILPLLEAGADPRIPNEGGELPQHVAGSAVDKDALQHWDTARTDAMVQAWNDQREATKAAKVAEKAKELQSAQSEYDQKLQRAEETQRLLRCARQDLEKRITEHDTCVQEQKPEQLLQVTLQHIHDQEEVVENLVKRNREATEALNVAKCKLREQEAGNNHGDASLPGIVVKLKDLDDILIKDIGGKLAADGRCPLVIDTSQRSSVFFRYMDSNYVNAVSPHSMDTQRLRRSLLGSLRYGKPLVLDLMDVALWHDIPRQFDAVHPNLLNLVLDGSITQRQHYVKLIRKEDGEEYAENAFQESRIAKYRFIITTSKSEPEQELLDRTYVLRVKVE